MGSEVVCKTTTVEFEICAILVVQYCAGVIILPVCQWGEVVYMCFKDFFRGLFRPILHNMMFSAFIIGKISDHLST